MEKTLELERACNMTCDPNYLHWQVTCYFEKDICVCVEHPLEGVWHKWQVESSDRKRLSEVIASANKLQEYLESKQLVS